MGTENADKFFAANKLYKDHYASAADVRLRDHLDAAEKVVRGLASILERVKQDTRRYRDFINDQDGCLDHYQAMCEVCDAVWFEEETLEEDVERVGQVPRMCKNCKRPHCKTCSCAFRKINRVSSSSLILEVLS